MEEETEPVDFGWDSNSILEEMAIEEARMEEEALNAPVDTMAFRVGRILNRKKLNNKYSKLKQDDLELVRLSMLRHELRNSLLNRNLLNNPKMFDEWLLKNVGINTKTFNSIDDEIAEQSMQDIVKSMKLSNLGSADVSFRVDGEYTVEFSVNASLYVPSNKNGIDIDGVTLSQERSLQRWIARRVSNDTKKYRSLNEEVLRWIAKQKKNLSENIVYENYDGQLEYNTSYMASIYVLMNKNMFMKELYEWVESIDNKIAESLLFINKTNKRTNMGLTGETVIQLDDKQIKKLSASVKDISTPFSGKDRDYRLIMRAVENIRERETSKALVEIETEMKRILAEYNQPSPSNDKSNYPFPIRPYPAHIYGSTMSIS